MHSLSTCYKYMEEILLIGINFVSRHLSVFSNFLVFVCILF